jgi:hypothetical protein
MTRPARHLRLEQTPLERGRLWVEIAAFVAAGCWAVYTFVYQTRIAPLFLPPHEVATMNVVRIATTPSSYLERVEVTLRNDGQTDVDSAAIALTVYGAKAGSELALHSNAATARVGYREIPKTAWKPLGAQGMLLDGAVDGRRGQHFVLRPGDGIPFDQLVVVPRGYDVLLLEFQTIFDRFPIARRVAVTLQNKNGAVLLKAKNTSIVLESYFGV